MTHVRFNRLPFQHMLGQLLTDTMDQVVVPAVRNNFQKPATNIVEQEQQFSLELLAPGFIKSDIKIAIDKNVLSISAKKEVEQETQAGTQVKHREFNVQSFERSFTLPENINLSEIEAKFENGILVVNLPKLAPTVVEPKQIAIS